MADRAAFPAAKASSQAANGGGGGAAANGGGAAANGGAPAFPATKGQGFATNRINYRPQAPPKYRRRPRRSCCCSCCLWISLFLVALVLAAAIAGAVIYVLYRPHRPSFSVTSLRLSAFNISSSSSSLSSRIDVAITARNPNRKIAFVYDETSVSVSSTAGVDVGDGSFPAFVHGAGNTTVLRTTLSVSGEGIDPSAASDLRKRSELPLVIVLETKAGAKIGSLKTTKLRIRVTCSGVSAAVPKEKSSSSAAAAAAAENASCKVSVRFKIWKWTT